MIVEIVFSPQISYKKLETFDHLAYGSIPAGAVEALYPVESMRSLGIALGSPIGEVADSGQIKWDLMEEVISKVLSKRGDLMATEYHMNRTYIDGVQYLIAWAVPV